MAKKDYDALAVQVIEAVGGAENVAYFAHCMTRLRFTLKDKSRVDTAAVDRIPGLLGSQWMNDQYQIIVGQDVGQLYAAACATGGLTQLDGIDENLDADLPDAPKEKKTPLKMLGNAVTAIASCVAPCIPILIAAGMLQCVISILTQFCGVDAADPTVAVLNLVSNAALYFLPIYIGSTAADKFGANKGLGMLMGGMMLQPTYVASVADGTPLSFFGLQFPMVSFASTVLPVILIVYVMSFIEKFVYKHTHEFIRAFIAPLVVVLVMIPIVYVVLGPLGSYFSSFIVDGLVWIHETFGFLAVGLVGALYPALVATGLHTSMSPIMVQTFATYGYESLFYPGGCIGNTTQGFASLAVALKTKSSSVRATAISAGIPAVLGKVTEPALYGISLKYKIPFICAMVGGFVGGCFAGLVHTRIYFFGGGGILGFTGYLGSGGINELLLAMAGLLIGGAVTFVLTYIFYSDERCGVVSDSAN